jgi:cyclophilin family peptidyl-prolyl cis-trans isomerase
MNERFFYITVFVLIVITILGVFTLFKNSNQLAKSDKNSQVLSLVGDRSVKNLNEENIEDMKKIDENKKPDFILDNNKNYQAKLTTSEGEIIINLNTKETPITANNFVYLSEKGFYNNTIFHRVIEGFMIQGGDPLGNGTGGPGYRFDDEPFNGEYLRGVVAMANAGPNTNGSQFFIMHKDYSLPKNYVIFGEVIEGLNTVDKIATAAVQLSRSGEDSSPVEPIIIEKVEIITK